MSSEYPPLRYRDVIHGLKVLGFELRPKGSTAHEHWVKYSKGGILKVTVDKHLEPFGQKLITSMASQAGVSKKDFYKACWQ